MIGPSRPRTIYHVIIGAFFIGIKCTFCSIFERFVQGASHVSRPHRLRGVGGVSGNPQFYQARWGFFSGRNALGELPVRDLKSREK